MQGLSEVTKRKISLGNMEIKIMAFVMIAIKTILTKMMKTNIFLEKKSKFEPWQVFVAGAHRYQQDTFNGAVQYIVAKIPGIDTDEAEEVNFDKLEPRYRAEVINCYQRFLEVSKAMKIDPLHKEITTTAKRKRDAGEFDEDEALRYRGSYMSAHVLLNLLNEFFSNEFNKFNNTRARMLDSIYHMTLRLL